MDNRQNNQNRQYRADNQNRNNRPRRTDGSLNSPTDDPYIRQYNEQLNQFSRMDSENYFDDDVDLQFHNEMDFQGQNQNGQYANSRQYTNTNPQDNNYQQRPRSAQQYSQENYWEGNNQQRRPQPQGRPVQRQPQQRNRPVQQPQRVPRQQANQTKYANTSNSNPERDFKRQPKTSQSINPKPQKTKKQNTPKGKNKSVEKKKSPVKTFLKILLIIIIVLILIVNILIVRYISMVNTVESKQRDNDITPSMQSSSVKNILLIGSDTRNAEEAGRTDSMILLSVNTDTKEITMTSFMRDMYLPLVGYATDGTKMYDDSSADGLYYDKLNAAYVYGGAELLMDTIEYNFDIKVDDYVYIDFYSFIDIVDALGGIKLTVTDEEAEGMTAPMAEQNKYLGNEKGTDYLTAGGDLLMNGNQALAYARLRYVGNADFQRTERQRTVINTIISTAKSSSPLTLDKFAKACMSNLTTNMSKTDLYFYCYKALFYMNYKTNSLRIPDDNSYTYGTHNGQSTLDVDINTCRQLIKETIYN